MGSGIRRVIPVLVLLISLPGWAAEYYVSPAGADSNPGTANRPWRTLQHAADAVKPGDTVIAEDGMYSNPAASGVGSTLVNSTRGGSAGHYVTFRARHKWGAVLDGWNNTTAEAWEFGADYIRVQDFEIRGFSDDAFSNFRGGQFIQLAGNHIHDIGRYCTDTGTGRDGIFLSHGNVLIEQNLVHDIGRFSAGENGCSPRTKYYQSNDHGIYISGGASNVLIRNNIFYRIRHGFSLQVYPKPVRQLFILNNTFAFGNSWYPGYIVVAAPVTDGRIQNNIFYEPNTAAVYIDPTDGKLPATSTLSIENNLTDKAMVQMYLHSTGKVTLDREFPGLTLRQNRTGTDALLANPSSFDFRLRRESPAIGAGLPTPEVVTDYAGAVRGTPPSIGAYEAGDGVVRAPGPVPARTAASR